MFFFNNHINEVEEISGIYNCGTGKARSFNSLALATVNACRARKNEPQLTLEEAIKGGIIEYIPFPGDLAGRYQCYTQANLDYLREADCVHEFLSLEDGISNYVSFLLNN